MSKGDLFSCCIWCYSCHCYCCCFAVTIVIVTGVVVASAAASVVIVVAAVVASAAAAVVVVAADVAAAAVAAVWEGLVQSHYRTNDWTLQWNFEKEPIFQGTQRQFVLCFLKVFGQMEGGSPSEAGVPLIDAGSITTTTSERIQVVASVHKQVTYKTYIVIQLLLCNVEV